MTRSTRMLFEVEAYLMRKYGITMMEHYITPLVWYLNTGRCPLALEKWLCTSKPYVIGRVLAQGGSYDETIARLWKKSGIGREVA